MKGERMAGGLPCSRVLELLGAFVDGSIDPADRDRVIAHLQECRLCERFGGTYAELTRRIRSAARTEEPEPSVLERLRLRLDLPR